MELKVGLKQSFKIGFEDKIPSPPRLMYLSFWTSYGSSVLEVMEPYMQMEVSGGQTLDI